MRLKNKLSAILIIIGIFFVILALSFLVYARYEASNAEKASSEVLPILIQQIENNKSNLQDNSTITINGNDYIGYLSIPKLDLKLPVMSGWSYKQLKISPCRFMGSHKDDNLVVMAHNYTRHFGKIHTLKADDIVYFQDLGGNTIQYKVSLLQTLSGSDIDKVSSEEYDLTLFTCTYSGKNRILVRCNRI